MVRMSIEVNIRFFANDKYQNKHHTTTIVVTAKDYVDLVIQCDMLSRQIFDIHHYMSQGWAID